MTTTASISVGSAAPVQYVLRLGDACLLHAQRLAEWCGHAPIVEEDMALTNIALDLIGQARALLTHAARLDGQGHDEDQLAFLRDERDYRNPTLAELPSGPNGTRDFAFTVLRALFLSTWQKLGWLQLANSCDAELAAIAGKALKEARYHQQHAADWVVRLGDGTDESARRLRAALEAAWPFVAELFEDDEVDVQAAAAGLGPRASALREAWQRDIDSVFAEACLAVPPPGAFRSHGRQGRHSEHMGFLLAQMQYLQRSFPGGVW
jgi:ring-1,2-phenylacetyl-CoA epoxidase subunit PaaC